jgi:hypothetical protein
LELPEYRSFLRSPSLRSPSNEVIEIRESNQKAFIQCLKRASEGNQQFLEAGKFEPFFILGDLYHIVASNWNLDNEYINRELSTIEYILEKEEPGFHDLETYFKEHYVYHRRHDKYDEFITETKDQCTRRGQKCWPRDPESALMVEHGKDLEDDFIHPQSKDLGNM